MDSVDSGFWILKIMLKYGFSYFNIISTTFKHYFNVFQLYFNDITFDIFYSTLI
jgi:hypothetical protein